MARNAPAAYGVSLRCWDDADEFFSTVTWLDAVVQDVYHVLTNRHFLGPSGESRGEDVTRWAGMPADQLARRGPVLVEVITRDERVETADVNVSAAQIKIGSTLYTGTIDIRCTTALGPFRRIFGFNSATVADITAILSGDS